MADDPRQNPLLLFRHLQPLLPPLPQIRDQSERKKIKIQWVNSDHRRRATRKKRRDNILKKAEELNVLCGVQVNAIIFSPEEEFPVVYPSVDETETMCTRFAQLPEMERANFMRTHQQFLKKRREGIHKKAVKKPEPLTVGLCLLLRFSSMYIFSIISQFLRVYTCNVPIS